MTRVCMAARTRGAWQHRVLLRCAALRRALRPSRAAPPVRRRCGPWRRYSNPKAEGLDVMYRNIRFAFFQPAENDMITLLHFHLHNPIMIGNKKTKDVQFYAEVRVCVCVCAC
jgi:hypothetical protein